MYHGKYALYIGRLSRLGGSKGKADNQYASGAHWHIYKTKAYATQPPYFLIALFFAFIFLSRQILFYGQLHAGCRYVSVVCAWQFGSVCSAHDKCSSVIGSGSQQPRELDAR